MPVALGPRFVLEAGFLVLLALVVGLADLDPWLIIVVMLVGWLLVSLIEYFSWRQAQAALVRRFESPSEAVVDEEVVEEAPPPPPPPVEQPPPTPPAEEQTIAEPAAEHEGGVDAPAEAAPAEEASAAQAEAPTAFSTAEERRVAHRLEPLQPRPRRRWILFGRYERRGESAEDDNEA
jgi:hypothetical protein